VDQMVLIQDSHPEGAEEFEAFPEHCLTGSLEARHVAELEAVPGFAGWQRFEKNSISALENTGLRAWLDARPRLRVLVAAGDVTDLCLYSLAVGLKLRSIAANLGQEVVVPANCVQTWDSPDHPGDLYHALFLRQLARNGVRVVREVR